VFDAFDQLPAGGAACSDGTTAVVSASHNVQRAGLGRAYQQRSSPLNALLLWREALDERLDVIVLPVRLLHVRGVGNV